MGIFRRRKDLEPLVVDRTAAKAATFAQDDTLGPDARGLEAIETDEAIREASQGARPGLRLGLNAFGVAGKQVLFTGDALGGNPETLHGSHPDPDSIEPRLMPDTPRQDD